jgi:hypothetical protein
VPGEQEGWGLLRTTSDNISMSAFAFKCEKKQWTAISLTIDKFDMANGGKLIGEPVIHCEEEEDCICHARCNCPLPQWVTTRLGSSGVSGTQ